MIGHGGICAGFEHRMSEVALGGFDNAALGAVKCEDLHETLRTYLTPTRIWLATFADFEEDRVTYTHIGAGFRKAVEEDTTIRSCSHARNVT